MIIFQDNMNAVNTVNGKIKTSNPTQSHGRYRNIIIEILERIEKQGIQVEAVYVPSHQESKDKEKMEKWRREIQDKFPEWNNAPQFITKGNIEADKQAEEAITNNNRPKTQHKHDFMLRIQEYKIIDNQQIQNLTAGVLTPLHLPTILEHSIEGNIAKYLGNKVARARCEQFKIDQRLNNKLPEENNPHINWKNSAIKEVSSIQEYYRQRNMIQCRFNRKRTATRIGTMLRQSHRNTTEKKRFNEEQKEQRRLNKEADPRIGCQGINAIPAYERYHTGFDKRTERGATIDEPHITLYIEKHVGPKLEIQLTQTEEFKSMINERQAKLITQTEFNKKITKLRKQTNTINMRCKWYNHHRDFFCPNCKLSSREIIEDVKHMLICPTNKDQQTKLIKDIEELIRGSTKGMKGYDELWKIEKSQQNEFLDEEDQTVTEEQKLNWIMYYYEPIGLQRIIKRYQKEGSPSIREKYYKLINQIHEEIAIRRKISMSMIMRYQDYLNIDGRYELDPALLEQEEESDNQLVINPLPPEPPHLPPEEEMGDFSLDLSLDEESSS
jgi:hypothetical protein